MTNITLLTDFGLKDGNVGVMKGVILAIAPDVRIIDLSHSIAPQNLHEAAFVLNRSATYFQEGTIHVVVVDPGVGTERLPIAARIGPYYFVGPDNGVATRLIERAGNRDWSVDVFALDQPNYWLSQVSNVFHGRDIFAPVAAHIANGASLEDVGSHISDPIRLSLPKLVFTDNSLKGEVIYVDHFGSLVTNIRQGDMADVEEAIIRIKDAELHGLVRTFGDAPTDSVVGLFSSTGDLIISVVNGSASERLQAGTGEEVQVILPG